MSNLEALEIVGMLVAAYPTPAWEPPTIRLYAQRLEDLDKEPTEAAVLEFIDGRTKSDRPTIGEIRAAVAALLDANKPGGRALEVDEAWGFVTECFTRIGGYGDFPDKHPLVAKAVAAMGWREMCQSDNIEATRAHFSQFYRALLERSKRDAAVSPGASIAIEGPSRPRIGADGQPRELTHVRDVLTNFLPQTRH